MTALAHPQLAPASSRMVRCAWCRQPVRLIVASKHQGVCPLCVAENAELGWRTVYDRRRGLGEIPANLRAAYNL
ncbi:MAG TPA: hypothetical protein VEC38_10225 [Candidatus Binataceae bacterium]|nr:hypothetical protein [Candidatus Binataceae bacterium]